MSAYSTEVLADSPTGYWRLDETSGTSAADLGSGSHAGTYVNTPTKGVAGCITDGTAVHFTAASSQDLTIPSQTLSTTGTIECWFKWTAGAIPCRDATGSGGWVPIWDNSGTITVRVAAADIATSLATTAVRNGAAHHLVVSKSGATVNVYIDNVVVGTSSSAANTASVSPWHFGKSGTQSAWADVTFDEIAIYSTALTADRVNAHFIAGLGFAGTIASTSTLTGALTDQVALTGTVASTSTLTGALTDRAALAGTVASTSTLTATLTNTPATKALAGTIAATSAMTGDVTATPLVSNELAGEIGSWTNMEGQLDPVVPPPQFAIHWFWEPDRYSEAPDTPTECPQCGAKVITVDFEVICRHYRAGSITPDGVVVEDDCPYIATLTGGPAYAQPLPGDPVL